MLGFKLITSKLDSQSDSKTPRIESRTYKTINNSSIGSVKLRASELNKSSFKGKIASRISLKAKF